MIFEIEKRPDPRPRAIMWVGEPEDIRDVQRLVGKRTFQYDSDTRFLTFDEPLNAQASKHEQEQKDVVRMADWIIYWPKSDNISIMSTDEFEKQWSVIRK